MGRSVAAKQTQVFVSRMPLGDNKVNTIGIRRQTGRPGRPYIRWNTCYKLRSRPALVRVFCDEDTTDSLKTKGVAIRREGCIAFPLVWSVVTD
jgi:hypothetical protein